MAHEDIALESTLKATYISAHPLLPDTEVTLRYSDVKSVQTDISGLWQNPA